jgi:hypothetical protein
MPNPTLAGIAKIGRTQDRRSAISADCDAMLQTSGNSLIHPQMLLRSLVAL